MVVLQRQIADDKSQSDAVLQQKQCAGGSTCGAAISSPTWLNLCRRPLFSPGRPHPSLKTWKHLQALLHHYANVLLLLLYPSIHHNCESAQKVHACMGLNPRPFGLSGLILWLIPVGFGSIPMAVTQVMQY